MSARQFGRPAVQWCKSQGPDLPGDQAIGLFVGGIAENHGYVLAEAK
jgi:hypothetical protein